MDKILATEPLRSRARELGFDACHVADVISEADDGFDAWLAQGYHANMKWIERSCSIRQQVRLKIPNAKTVIVLAKTYCTQDKLPSASLPFRIARYARGRDYHKTLAKPLKALVTYISEVFPPAVSYASVDSGPVRERIWAARGGLGWIGRNGLIIHPELGSWINLATIITSAPFQPDMPLEGQCGSCTACMDACPTQAIVTPRMVDARRCIAYHTIENKGEIPPGIKERLNGWIFGCDTCQEVCPWNKKIKTDVPAHVDQDGVCLDLASWLTMDQQQFRERFSETPLMRAGLEKLKRNVQAAATYHHEA